MNKRIKNINQEVLSDQWATLKNVTFYYQNTDGTWDNIIREVYDRGHGACILPYNVEKQTVLLIKQFRLPAYLTDGDGFLIEACAGIIENEAPQETVLREAMEELGYRLDILQEITTVYMSPGASTERIHLFTAPYNHTKKVAEGGGVVSENEDIEVVEYAFAKALKAIKTGEINDAKTVILLQHLALSKQMKSIDI